MLSRSHFAAAALLAVGLTACTPAEPGAPSSTAPTLPAFTTTSAAPTTTAQATDYTKLLLTAADISDAEDTFTERHLESSPGGLPGASAFFVNAQDTRAISSTILVYANPDTAATALKDASGTLNTRVVGGAPTPAGVGTNSVMVRGTDPDQAKDVTVLMFTEGPALVRLEFQSAGGDATTDGFVTNVGKMQQIALRVGLSDGR